MKTTVVLEIIIDDDIKEKYPNFISNYTSKEHFLQKYIENLNNNSDYGYKQKVLGVKNEKLCIYRREN